MQQTTQSNYHDWYKKYYWKNINENKKPKYKT